MRKHRIKHGKGSRNPTAKQKAAQRTRLLFVRNAELLAKAIARVPVNQFLFDSPDVKRLKKKSDQLTKKLRLEHE
jgi:hypothetical protein